MTLALQVTMPQNIGPKSLILNLDVPNILLIGQSILFLLFLIW